MKVTKDWNNIIDLNPLKIVEGIIDSSNWVKCFKLMKKICKLIIFVGLGRSLKVCFKNTGPSGSVTPPSQRFNYSFPTE